MKHGFSLVELSIVLVILGLLTGGILAGQSLIRASELRAVTSEYQRYQAAFHTFRDKYFAIAGDMNNATKFWGSAGGTGSDAACQTAGITAASPLTCNGDGDGILINGTTEEYYRAWQHLANAGLIEGKYNPNGTQTPGSTVPSSKLTAAYWHSRNGAGQTGVGVGSDIYAGTTTETGGNYGRNMFRFRNPTWSLTASGTAPLKPEEAWNIDTKLDDGKPGTGIVMSQKGDGVAVFCTSTAGTAVPANDANSTYRLDISAKDCNLDFVKAF